MKIHQLNITTASLNGDVDTQLNMKIPKLLEETLVKIIQNDEYKIVITRARTTLPTYKKEIR